MAVIDAFESYTGGIFNDTTGDKDIGHDISLVGYGVENGVKYWLGRNSWGSYWGEKGFFRIIRGTNNLAIESDCSWATPIDTWTNDDRNTTTNKVTRPTFLKEKTCNRYWKNISHITSP